MDLFFTKLEITCGEELPQKRTGCEEVIWAKGDRGAAARHQVDGRQEGFGGEPLQGAPKAEQWAPRLPRCFHLKSHLCLIIHQKHSALFFDKKRPSVNISR